MTGYVVELYGEDQTGRKMIAWGRRIGCRDVGHGFDGPSRRTFTKLLVDAECPPQYRYLLELADNPTGLRSISVWEGNPGTPIANTFSPTAI